METARCEPVSSNVDLLHVAWSLRAAIAIVTWSLLTAVITAVAGRCGPTHPFQSLLSRTMWRSVELRPLHRPRPLPLGSRSRRTELPRPILRTTCAELVPKFTLGEITTALSGTLPGIHARSHRHWSLRTAIAAKGAGFPRRALATTAEIGTWTLRKTVLAIARSGAMPMPAMLRLRTTCRGWALRALAPRIAITAVFARTTRTAVAATLTLESRAMMRTIAFAFHLGPRATITIPMPPLALIPAAWTPIAPAFRLRAAFARAALLGSVARWPRLAARCSDFIGADFAITVAIEFAQHVEGAPDFLRVDRAVVVGIKRAKDAMGPALTIATGADLGWSVAARLPGIALRRWRWRVLRSVLGEKRARGERECHRGEKSSGSFHRH